MSGEAVYVVLGREVGDFPDDKISWFKFAEDDNRFVRAGFTHLYDSDVLGFIALNRDVPTTLDQETIDRAADKVWPKWLEFEEYLKAYGRKINGPPKVYVAVIRT